MTEEEKFNKLISKDPSPGIKNRITRKENTYLIPGWVFDESDYIKVRYKSIGRYAEKHNYSGQILYDILVLGIINISQRPKCVICGKPLKYKTFNRGYGVICGDNPGCRSLYSKQEMINMWKNEEYINLQSESHINWARGNTENFRNNMLKLWQDKEYREKQIISHINYAKNHGYATSRKSIVSNLNKSTEEIFCDSSWEELFIRNCDTLDEIAKIERATFTIPYEFEGYTRNYYPDFIITFINNTKILVEIKANWMIDKLEQTRLKIKAGENFLKENNSSGFKGYLVLTEDVLFTSKKFNFNTYNSKLVKSMLLSYM